MIPSRTQLRQLLKFIASIAVFGVLFMLLLVIYIVTAMDGTATGEEDCILVFGAAVGKNSTSTPAIERRVRSAVRLMGEGSGQLLVLSGGKGSGMQLSEAEVMKKVAMLGGADPEQIQLESQSTSTWENLVFSRPLLGDCQAVVGVSDSYHLARIAYLANLQDFELTTHPATGRPPLPYEIKAILREAVGLVYYFAIHTHLSD